MKKRVLWKKIKQRGAILESNARSLMRGEGDLYAYDATGNLTDEVEGWMPRTYSFEGIPAYYSESAWIPTGNKKSPYEFSRFIYDEDEDQADEWISTEIRNPLSWQTELEFLGKISK